MTQSQLKLHSASQIVNWAGTWILRRFGRDDSIVFTEKAGMFYYFAVRPDCYELVMTSTLDLNGE